MWRIPSPWPLRKVFLFRSLEKFTDSDVGHPADYHNLLPLVKLQLLSQTDVCTHPFLSETEGFNMLSKDSIIQWH